MSSLSAHLRLPEDHSGLPFHPSCPVCRRDRLAGSLAGDEVVSRRTQAAIAVGLLAFSAVGAPTAAVAQVPDEVIDGSAEVVEGGDDGTEDLGEDLLPLAEAGPAPIEDEPLPTTERGAAEIEEAWIEESAEEPLAEPEDEPIDEPPATPEPVAIAAPPAEVPVTTGAPEQAAADVGPRVDRRDRTKRERRVEREAKLVQSTVAAPAPVAEPATSEAPAPVAVKVTAGTSTDATTSAKAEDAAKDGRFHVVQRGESLWSIAADLLGERASVPRIAREVNRLWALNEDRIASGDPDLVYAGTRLRL